MVEYAYSKKHNYIIGYSAKSGCTYVRQLFLELHKNELNGEPTYKWHHLGLDFKIPNNINIDKTNKIIVSRNPYKRTVSMFIDKYCGGPGAGLLRNKFTIEKTTFRIFVKKLLYFKINKKLNNIDVHIKEQSHNLNKNNAQFIKLEEFNENIVNAYKSLNLHNLVPSVENYLKKDIFKNESKKCNEEIFVYDKEYEIGNTIFPDAKYFYDNELLELVYYIYKDDFINFNYEKYII